MNELVRIALGDRLFQTQRALEAYEDQAHDHEERAAEYRRLAGVAREEIVAIEEALSEEAVPA